MTDPERWPDIAEVGFVSGMQLLFWIYRHLGAWTFRVVLQPVALYYFISNRRARRASMDYLQRVYAHTPEALGHPPGWFDVYRHINAFALSVVDKLGVWSGAPSLQQPDFPERPLLLRHLERGEGAVLLGAHLGNMEVCRSLARANRQLKLNILVHTGHADMFNKLLREMEVHRELELIEVSDLSPATAMRLSQCVARGEFIAILADRVPVASRGRSRAVEFMGASARFPEGPFILASLLKCPVYTLFCVPENKGYRIRCEEFAQRVRLPRGARDDALDGYMEKFARTLERNTLRSPYQWFNFYRFWEQS